jgi:large conductance mechanosensitive channel
MKEKAKQTFNEFKAFAMKGNVVDLAVGVIIGSAFGKIVSSLVADIIMPPLGLLMGGVDFANKEFILKAATDSAPAVVLRYGVFINSVIDFIIISFAIFMVIKQLGKLKKQDMPPEPNTKDCPFCFTNISIKATKCPNCTSSL